MVKSYTQSRTVKVENSLFVVVVLLSVLQHSKIISLISIKGNLVDKPMYSGLTTSPQRYLPDNYIGPCFYRYFWTYGCSGIFEISAVVSLLFLDALVLCAQHGYFLLQDNLRTLNKVFGIWRYMKIPCKLDVADALKFYKYSPVCMKFSMSTSFKLLNAFLLFM